MKSVLATIQKRHSVRYYSEKVIEKNILMLTDLGLSTCWIGGSLNRSVFAQKK